MSIIILPYGDNSFDSDDLKLHIEETGRGYIIQGQKACTRAQHPKPNSLDCWLRDNYARNPDTKQAVNAVIHDLLQTGDFVEGQLQCPDSGRNCKGLKLSSISGVNDMA
ncbi:MAG TPA: hypothetical protein ENN79_07975 [Desulfobacteraceae bacterium]|nr:hypothetical protein [Desulfobacteraceae bacterium]